MLQRRRFIQGVGATGLAPLAAVLADPELAAAAAATLETVETETPHGTVRAALARPAESPAPAVLLIHEWWGLNDQIKSVAAELAALGYLGLAVDLYHGQVASAPDQAQALTRSVDPGAATETLVSWARWLKSNPESSGKVGVIGWCFGGGWSLALSLAEPIDATVIYYGRCTQSAAELKALKGPVLGHFATQDPFITVAMAEGFRQALAEAHKPAEIHFYEANHAFANPTGAAYDQADAALAWSRTTDFLSRNLKG